MTRPPRLDYVSVSEVPSLRANSIQTARVCEGFVEAGAETTVWYSGRRAQRGLTPASLAAFYGLRRPPLVRRTPAWASRSPAATALWAAAGIRLRGARTRCMCRSPLVALVLRGLGLPVLLEVHSLTDATSRSWRMLRRWPWRRRLTVVAISRSLQAELVAELAGRAPVVFEPDCVQALALEHTTPAPAASRPVIGYAGRVSTGRGIDLIAELAGRCPDFDFRVAGPVEESFRPEVETWVAQNPNLTWVGQLAPRDVADFLTGCDALLAPYAPSVASAQNEDTSRWMSPLKVFEYLASARPMLVSDLPAIRDVIPDEAALLLPARDTRAWAEALTDLMANRDRRESYAAAARQLATRFTWRARAERLLGSRTAA